MPLNATYGGAGGNNKVSKTEEISRETITAQDKDGNVAVYKVKYAKNEISEETIENNPSLPTLFVGKMSGGSESLVSFEVRCSNTDVCRKTETKMKLTQNG